MAAALKKSIPLENAKLKLKVNLFMVLKQVQGTFWYHMRQFHQNSAQLQPLPSLALLPQI